MENVFQGPSDVMFSLQNLVVGC